MEITLTPITDVLLLILIGLMIKIIDSIQQPKSKKKVK
jgi:biopolymer transport protein ExbD